jgi:hypothetical protein
MPTARTAAIRDDESEHVATMSQCQNRSVLIRSRNVESALTLAAAAAALAEAIVAQLPEDGVAGLGTLLSLAEDLLESSGIL